MNETTRKLREWIVLCPFIIFALLAPTAPAENFNHDGDFEGNGNMNPMVYNEATGEWQVLTSRNNYNPESFFLGGPGWSAIQSDYDGDGRTDLVAYNRTTGEWQILFSCIGYNPPVNINFGGTGWVVVTGDYDGDGKADFGVSWPDNTAGGWRMWRSSRNYSGHDDSEWQGDGFRPVQR